MPISPRVSVIIPTFQRRESVVASLRALTAQILPAVEFEVIVSIDGSSDGTQEALDSLSTPFNLRVIWHPNRGRAYACNVGIRLARCEILVILDDDMEPSPGLLAAHLSAHVNATRLGVVGAVPIRLNSTSAPVTRYIGEKFNRHLANLARQGDIVELREFYSGNFSIRREVLLEIGMFDEAFRVYGNEDLELSLRLRRAGVRLIYDAEAVAQQHYDKDFEALARDNIEKGRTAVMLVTKHPEALRELRLNAFDQDSVRWRILRRALLSASTIVPWTPDMVSLAIRVLEKGSLDRMDLYYRFAIDYYYWLGAEAALRENRRSGKGLSSLRCPNRAT